ncbi:MAG: RNA polymerase sigma factor [Alphaproteobacteria bacterium]|nr:MAG: RNA polymerase sigma factor [Alphaproteobacteria bacterium]
MTTPPGARDDAALSAAVIAGDSRAFTELMRRHKEALYRFIRRYVGDADEAYDLLQDTFLAAWSALPGFDSARPMRAWLRRIALNKCRDWSRRRSVRRFFFAAAPIDNNAHRVAIPASETDPEQERRLADLDRQIANLPAGLKEPLLLTQFEGLSHKEAAQILNISPKAVEMRIYRARAQLASGLGLPPAGDEG